MDGVSIGNCGLGPPGRRGWIVGRFLAEDPNRRTDAVEVKWGVHARGEKNGAFASNRTATTISILVSGRFRLRFRGEGPELAVVLEGRGDYALWSPGIYHDWEAEDDCEIVTIRWPSAEGDQVIECE